MSLERRVAQLKQESKEDRTVYSVIEGALKRDRDVLFTYFKQNRGSGQCIDEELVDVYELRPDSIPFNVSFMSGFSLVISTWYPAIRVLTSHNFKSSDEHFFDSEFGRRFRDRVVTSHTLRDALIVDPSGATWLEEMAGAEFRQENLELLGARKAITGIRKMHELLTVTA